MTTRNSNAHFELAPQVEIERSTFNRDCTVKTSFDVGRLVPFYVDEVLAGDTFQIETSKVARLQTLIAPVMDNLFLDTYYFFVPNRLVWSHWKEFCGENNTFSKWYEDPTQYSIPQVLFPDDGWDNHTLADYMGIPTKVGQPTSATYADMSVNALPFRAYCQIVNDWFRDENLQQPLWFDHGETTHVGLNPTSTYEYQSTYLGGNCFIANKTHDYFTSCLPGPQKGESVPLFDGIIPIQTYNGDLSGTSSSSQAQQALMWKQTNNIVPSGKRNIFIDGSESKMSSTDSSLSASGSVFPINLYADLGNIKDYRDGAWVHGDDNTINSLRQAFAIQRLLEKDARGGTRYIEILKSHFGVTSPDARLQRAEYLGGNRVPLNIEQVINTTGNEQMSLLPGDASGWSQTNDVSYDVEKSFVEHGYIIGLMCVRYDHSYQQGLERMWMRKDRFDFYWPALAHLGEQAVYKDEIYLSPTNTTAAGTRDVFGYQEAWAEYRYKPNYVTGSMRSNENNSLDIWHFADNYDSEPYLNNTWLMENKDNVDRALAVTSNVENQVFVDVFIKNKCTRAMPLYSIPGLIDHF